jgi:tetratricopeptide (TPR) repeat protein
MSLLMDALKKAELAKRQGQAEAPITPATSAPSEESAADAGGMTLEPLELPLLPENSPAAPDMAQSGNPPTPESSPSLSLRLEALDEEFLAEIEKTSNRPHTSLTRSAARAQPDPRRSGAGSGPIPIPVSEQTAAHNLFAAKQPPAAAQKKTFALVLGGVTALATVAIGVYFWWQLQPRQISPGLAVNPVAVSPQPTILPVAPVTPVQPIATLPPHIPTDTEEDETDEEVADTAAAAKPASSTSRSGKELKPAAIAAADEKMVHLTKTPLRIDPSLMRGYDAFNRGDLASAQTEYTRALQADPRNTDALHGLAAIALRQGQLDQAAAGYQKILEANPQDAAAMAALINIRSQMDPAAAESRLKALAAAQPELAAPDFSLGNLYAKQDRWNEAQQAYFRAYNAEPENPDILYNLAISLEHLHQIRLATQYYAQALAAAQTRPASFDKAQATARLHALQP